MGKKFIDKKKSATFQILARDYSDPNYSDGPSGDRVFVRVDSNPYQVGDVFEDESVTAPGDEEVDDPYSVFADAEDDYDDDDGGDDLGKRIPTPSQSAAAPLPDYVRREILELGFPDDGYNYLLHLREIKNAGGGAAYYHNSKADFELLPNDVKAYDATRVEVAKVDEDSVDKVIYNVASKTVGVKIQKAVDPEVAKLLDDSDLSRFDSDEEDLDEDFVIMANLPEGVDEVEFHKKLDLAESSGCKKEETAQSSDSRSQTSEVRNHQPIISRTDEKTRDRPLRPIDELFDELHQHEYDSDDGTVEEDGHEGCIAEEMKYALKDCGAEIMVTEDRYIGPAEILQNKDNPKNGELVESAAAVLDRCREYAEKYENCDDDEDLVVMEESSDESEAWDCETIVSTYSNLENHPVKIGAPEARRKKKLAETVAGARASPGNVIVLQGKEQIPVGYGPHSKRPAEEKAKDVPGSIKSHQPRKKHGKETKEEKKERKESVKEEKREARLVKKEMKGLYRCEAQRAQRVAAFTGPSSIHLM